MALHAKAGFAQRILWCLSTLAFYCAPTKWTFASQALTRPLLQQYLLGLLCNTNFYMTIFTTWQIIVFSFFFMQERCSWLHLDLSIELREHFLIAILLVLAMTFYFFFSQFTFHLFYLDFFSTLFFNSQLILFHFFFNFHFFLFDRGHIFDFFRIFVT